MAIDLTEQQLIAVKSMTEFAECFADQVRHIMKDHGLDKIDGCSLVIQVNPKHVLTGNSVYLGTVNTDFGYIVLSKGVNDEKYTAVGRNTPEYEYLFADEALRSRMDAAKKREKPLPPDGLWVGDSRNDPPVDCGEWDIDDSLS